MLPPLRVLRRRSWLRRNEASFTGLLDTYGGAAAAYSIRALSSSFQSSDLILARRSSDDAELGFTATEITDGTLTTWAGAGDAFVKTWYDQSGNALDYTQTLSTAQPQIVSSGSLILDANSNASMSFDGTDDFMHVADPVIAASNTGAFSLFVTADTTTGDTGYIWSNGVTNGTAFYTVSGNQLTLSSAGGTGSTGDQATGSAGVNLFSVVYNNNDVDLRFSGATGTNAFSYAFATGSSNFTIGNRPGGSVGATFWQGKLSSLIIYNTAQTSNRAAIESNIATQYGITLA